MSVIVYHKSSDKKISIVCGRGVSKKFPLHRHLSYSIGTILKGCRLLRIFQNHYLIGEGDIFVINSEEPHAIGETIDTSHDYIVVSVAPELISHNQDKKAFRNIVQDTEMYSILNILFVEAIANKGLNEVGNKINQLISGLNNHVNENNNNGSNEHHIQSVRELLDKDITSNHSTELLAGKAFLSTFHFSRKFQKQTGLSPHQYLMDNRLRFARELLEKGHPIFDIAIAAGFYDSSHFIRHFTEYFGVSPSTYQKGINNLPL